MTDLSAFFEVHRDIPRQGPGLADDVLWALKVADVPVNAKICDAGCGPGADLVTLAEALPDAKLEGVDVTSHLVAEARSATAAFGPRVSVIEGSYLELPSSPYDFIWCAGAAYIAGVPTVLDLWRGQLAAGGHVAFSHPAWLCEPPSDEARTFWEEYPEIDGLEALEQTIRDAGWDIVDGRWIVGPAWEAYYAPLQDRLHKMRTESPSADVLAAVEAAETEIARWRAAPDEIAYRLTVVRPA